jgi:hypothetical protein
VGIALIGLSLPAAHVVLGSDKARDTAALYAEDLAHEPAARPGTWVHQVDDALRDFPHGRDIAVARVHEVRATPTAALTNAKLLADRRAHQSRLGP